MAAGDRCIKRIRKAAYSLYFDKALRFQCCDCRGGGGGRRNAGCHEEAPRHFAFGRLPVDFSFLAGTV